MTKKGRLSDMYKVLTVTISTWTLLSFIKISLALSHNALTYIDKEDILKYYHFKTIHQNISIKHKYLSNTVIHCSKLVRTVNYEKNQWFNLEQQQNLWFIESAHSDDDRQQLARQYPCQLELAPIATMTSLQIHYHNSDCSY